MIAQNTPPWHPVMAQGIEVKDLRRVPAELAVKFNRAAGLVVRAMPAHPHADERELCARLHLPA